MNKSEVTQEPKKVPFNKIEADFRVNSRTSYEGIEELAASIAEHGLLEPITVTQNGGDTYKLAVGFRRYQALKHLKLGSTPIHVMVQKFDRDIDLHLANLTENLERKELHVSDQAARFHELVNGTYPRVLHPDPAGGEKTVGEKIDKKELARRTGLTEPYISNLIRAHRQVTPDVKKMWKRFDVPLTTVLKWAPLEPEKQLEEFGAWKQEKDRVEAEGKAPKKEKEKPSKSNGKNESEESATEVRAAPTKGEVLEELGLYTARLEKGGLRGTELEVLKAKHKALRWVLGDISRETLRRST